MAEKLIRLSDLLKFPIRINHYDKENGNEHFVLGIESVLEYAEHLPTVDAVEVVHGRWVNWKGEPIIPDDCWRVWRCSECKHEHEFDEAVFIDEFPSKYCPNCGAKMDGDGNG